MASGGGKMSKGGSSKSRGALGQAEVVKKTVHKLTTPQMHVMTLRTALFDEHGMPTGAHDLFELLELAPA